MWGDVIDTNSTNMHVTTYYGNSKGRCVTDEIKAGVTEMLNSISYLSCILPGIQRQINRDNARDQQRRQDPPPDKSNSKEE